MTRELGYLALKSRLSRKQDQNQFFYHDGGLPFCQFTIFFKRNMSADGNAEPQSKVGCYIKIRTLEYIIHILCLLSDVFFTDQLERHLGEITMPESQGYHQKSASEKDDVINANWCVQY